MQDCLSDLVDTVRGDAGPLFDREGVVSGLQLDERTLADRTRVSMRLQVGGWWMAPYSRANGFASAAEPVTRCSQNPYATDAIYSSVRYSWHCFTPGAHHAVRT